METKSAARRGRAALLLKLALDFALCGGEGVRTSESEQEQTVKTTLNNFETHDPRQEGLYVLICVLVMISAVQNEFPHMQKRERIILPFPCTLSSPVFQIIFDFSVIP